MTGIGKEIRGF